MCEKPHIGEDYNAKSPNIHVGILIFIKIVTIELFFDWYYHKKKPTMTLGLTILDLDKDEGRFTM